MTNSKLKIRREELKLTQKMVAKKLGISESAYQRYERGENEPSASRGVEIADALKTTSKKLFG